MSGGAPGALQAPALFQFLRQLQGAADWIHCSQDVHVCGSVAEGGVWRSTSGWGVMSQGTFSLESSFRLL